MVREAGKELSKMSNTNRSRILTAVIPATLLFTNVACHGPCRDQTANQLHQSHMDRSKALYGRHLDDMADNAILHDMSLADHHFVPHSSEISGTGAHRLNRMAHLLNTYGGTVHYQTDLADTELVNKRIAHAKEYLTVAGCDMDRVQVKTGLSGGRGMPASKAIEVEVKGTAKPSAGAATTGFMAPSTSAGR